MRLPFRRSTLAGTGWWPLNLSITNSAVRTVTSELVWTRTSHGVSFTTVPVQTSPRSVRIRTESACTAFSTCGDRRESRAIGMMADVSDSG